MNEFVSSAFLLVAEVALFLFIALGAILFVLNKKNTRIKEMVRNLVARLKSAEDAKQEDLQNFLIEKFELEEEKASSVVESLIRSEKRLYTHLIAVCTGDDVDKLKELDKDIDKLIYEYKMLGVEEGEDNKEKTEAPTIILRDENKALREKNKQLQRDLDAAMETMESMMAEYTSMYEGGQKGGEQRMKNEMFKLKQTLESKVDLDADDMAEDGQDAGNNDKSP